MGTDAKRPLAWVVLSSLSARVKTGTANQIEKRGKERQEFERGSAERVWWGGC